MTRPVLFAILLAVVTLITVGALIAFRLIVEHHSTHPVPTTRRPRRDGSDGAGRA